VSLRSIEAREALYAGRVISSWLSHVVVYDRLHMEPYACLADLAHGVSGLLTTYPWICDNPRDSQGDEVNCVADSV